MLRQRLVILLIAGIWTQATASQVKKPVAQQTQSKKSRAPKPTPAPTLRTETPPASNAVKLPIKTDRTANRQGIILDYNSWFENIRIQGGTPYETKALLYGIGVSYEYNLLRLTWGWGLGGGLIHGYAVSGDSSDTSSYYAKRVPLEIGRFNGRIFRRVSPRFDLGLLTSVLYTLTNFPASNGLTVEKSGSVMMGAFLDTRWRLDGRWELIQAFGTFNRGPSLAWRLGAIYIF